MKHFKLPKKFLDEWIEALESDKYNQISGSLASEIDDNDVVGYCCLGVACKVLNYEDLDIRGHSLLHEIKFNDGIPKELLKYSGLISGRSLPQLLANLNDGFSFTDYENYKNEYPELKFNIIPANKNGVRVVYSFSDISQFLKDNVETYEV